MEETESQRKMERVYIMHTENLAVKDCELGSAIFPYFHLRHLFIYLYAYIFARMTILVGTIHTNAFSLRFLDQNFNKDPLFPIF